jgi:bacteriorhodopsin
MKPRVILNFRTLHHELMFLWSYFIIFAIVKEALQIIRENLKDEPWLTVLCKKLQ